MMKRTDIAEFLKLAEEIPVTDVRSPKEYEEGHIPGAINIPLFDDEERARVGTKYKKEGRIAAIMEGLDLSGPRMTEKLRKALQTAKNGKLLVHCWRGGMRSEAMAWLFSLAGIETYVLEGGYKSYRHLVLDTLAAEREMIILGGMTGSSKTHILRYLKQQGRQVVDLEGLANHKGSAFGALGQLPQPSTEQFSNDLYEEWRKLSPGEPVWLEDESQNIGTVFMPQPFYANMQKAKTIILKMDVATRLPRLIEEYSRYSAGLLSEGIMKISRRLGGDNTREALDAIGSGDISRAIEISLRYYDKAYQFSLDRKNNRKMIYVSTDTDDIRINAEKVLEALNSTGH
jgi:tRNA 2-selenouridine synthase